MRHRQPADRVLESRFPKLDWPVGNLDLGQAMAVKVIERAFADCIRSSECCRSGIFKSHFDKSVTKDSLTAE